ncbi:hypothetical protein [Methanobacterium sp.]|uniref:hypothetical protein n=1 Tax=Methanobacterium sp. TaxID=2164 RepID=UPI0025EFFB00|nr:hypothetical protein [Methanobacterium sp.]MBI5458578.1 hypothetical protein [Methanobacterium sp.]
MPKWGLGPIIGSFIAVYLVEVSYDNGIFYGRLTNKHTWTYIRLTACFLITKPNNTAIGQFKDHINKLLGNTLNKSKIAMYSTVK